MTTFLIAAAIILAIRACHRFVMRSVEQYDYASVPPKEVVQHDDYLYVGTHTDFKRRSKV